MRGSEGDSFMIVVFILVVDMPLQVLDEIISGKCEVLLQSFTNALKLPAITWGL